MYGNYLRVELSSGGDDPAPGGWGPRASVAGCQVTGWSPSWCSTSSPEAPSWGKCKTRLLWLSCRTQWTAVWSGGRGWTGHNCLESWVTSSPAACWCSSNPLSASSWPLTCSMRKPGSRCFLTSVHRALLLSPPHCLVVQGSTAAVSAPDSANINTQGRPPKPNPYSELKKDFKH